MLTNQNHILDLDGLASHSMRNANCTFGGDKIVINIQRPENYFISGVELEVQPYIPKQFKNDSQLFKSFNVSKNFDEKDELLIELTVVPEYSYTIKGAFTCFFGSLDSSKVYQFEGEYERLLNKVGCYVKNDFYFVNDTVNENMTRFSKSSFDCSESCLQSSECTVGWSYQISSKQCIFMNNNVTISDLQADVDSGKTDNVIGWASGVKSCSQPGENRYIIIIILNAFISKC